MSSGTGKAVMITGANGFLASHIVKLLLERGYKVHACVRDASKADSIKHLQALPNADKLMKFFSTGSLDDPKLREEKRFDEPMAGCDAVFHAATPLLPGSKDGENEIFKPAMASTHELLDAITRHADKVKHLVLTSSMSAVAPKPVPALKDESHWSDPEEMKKSGSWYGAAKTSQEQLTKAWVEKSRSDGTIASDFHYAAICPTFIVGPSLKEYPSSTMSMFAGWLKGKLGETAPNDTMSFIHVEDAAAMHVNALEKPDSEGRYLGVVGSLHWNDITAQLMELYPKMVPVKPYDGDGLEAPTKFNLAKMNTLGVKVRSIEEILGEGIKYLQSTGTLD